MRMTLAAAAMAGLCLLLMEASQAQAQSSARCGNFYNQVTAAVGRSDRAALVRLLALPASQQCAPEAQSARSALARLAAPPPVVPPVAPPVAPPVSPPARQVSPPPPVVRADPSAEEAAAWRIASRTDTVAAYNAYLADYPNGRNASTARQRIAAPTPRVSPPPPPPITSLDARSTPADTRAPVMTNPSGLPDFALFRECDGCPEMVVIPGGSFMMGSPASEAEGDNDEDSQAGAGGAQVSVRVPRFAISRFETTWEEWGACVSASVCQQQEDEGYGRGRRPAINVDWETDTRAYVRFVNSRASGYRLPSEAEWEYAARAGTTTAFSWGNSISTGQAQYSWSISYNGGPTRTTTPAGTATVGSFQANPWGLYDMHGNVWEWVEDCYRDNLSGQTAAAYTSGDCSLRVLRGGSWNYSPQNLRSASRGWASSTVRGLFGGFRLARTL